MRKRSPAILLCLLYLASALGLPVRSGDPCGTDACGCCVGTDCATPCCCAAVDTASPASRQGAPLLSAGRCGPGRGAGLPAAAKLSPHILDALPARVLPPALHVRAESPFSMGTSAFPEPPGKVPILAS